VLLHLPNLYLADVAPHGAWCNIETILAGLRNHERKWFTFVVIEVGVSQNNVVRADN